MFSSFFVSLERDFILWRTMIVSTSATDGLLVTPYIVINLIGIYSKTA